MRLFDILGPDGSIEQSEAVRPLENAGLGKNWRYHRKKYPNGALESGKTARNCLSKLSMSAPTAAYFLALLFGALLPLGSNSREHLESGPTAKNHCARPF